MSYNWNRRSRLTALASTLVGAVTVCCFWLPRQVATAQQRVDPFAAIENHKTADLSTYLGSGGDPNAADGWGPLLAHAAIANQPDATELLLQHGADVNIRSGESLSIAALDDYIEVATVLISHGANVNSIAGGPSPLDNALTNNHSDMAVLLLNHGAIVPKNEVSMLFSKAVRLGDVTLTRLLLAKGFAPSDPEALGGLIDTTDKLDIIEVLLDAHGDVNAAHGVALADASEGGNLPIVNLLLRRGARTDIEAALLRLPLVLAADKGHEDVVKALLSGNADPNLKAINGHTAIFGAAEGGNELIIHDLLNAGANPDEGDNDNTTPLIVSSFLGFVEISQDLLQAKANPNAVNVFGETPLLAATYFGHGEIVASLLDAGAEVNVANKNGLTPLLNAANEGSPDIVMLLLKKGATQHVKISGKSPQDVAKQNGNGEALSVLKSGTLIDTFPKDFTLAESSEQPRTLRRELLDSLVFRDSYLLSASGSLGSSLGLTDTQKGALLREGQFLLASLNKMLDAGRAEIQAKVSVSLLPTAATQIKVADTGTAAAYTVQNTQEASGVITIDAKLLQANLITSLAPFLPAGSTVSAAAELAKIRESRRQLENLQVVANTSTTSTGIGNTKFGLGDIGNVGAVVDLMGLSQTVRPFATQYYGTLLFIVAHELGHVAMGHGITPVACPKRELDADQFAAYLLSKPLMAMSIEAINVMFGNQLGSFNRPPTGTALWLDKDTLSSYTGYLLFFDKTYEIANFGPSAQACTYPDPPDRLEIAAKAVESVRAANEKQMIKTLEHRKDIQQILNSGLVARLKILESKQ